MRLYEIHLDEEQIELSYYNEDDKVFLSCTSNNPAVRALEFMDYVIGQDGIVKGKKEYAKGEMALLLVKAAMEEDEIDDEYRFFESRCKAYFTDVTIIEAKDYVVNYPNCLDEYQLYQKKAIPWAYVETLDITEDGSMIEFSTLENTNGVQIQAGPNKFIMIGVQGEIYDIEKEKFEATYDKDEKPLDVFEQMMTFIPEIYLPAKKTYHSIDEAAHLCYPKTDKKIYAKQLHQRTKVFNQQDRSAYFVGNKGDYLAIRMDDLTDIYVIRSEIFEDTYSFAGGAYGQS